MIRFIVIAVIVLLALPHVLGLLGGSSLGGSSVIFAIVALLAIVLILKGRTALISSVVVLWLVWSFAHPMYQAARKATAAGLNVPGQTWAAIKEAGKVAAEKLVGKATGLPSVGGTAIGVAQGVNEAAEELAMAEQLCLKMPFVKAKFLDDGGTAMYCQNQDVGIKNRLKAYIDGAFKGAAGPVFPFIADDPSQLDLDKAYFDCLRDAAALSVPEARECYVSDILTVPHKWRLCMELAMQVRRDDLMHRAPLAPEIAACRMKAKHASQSDN